MLPFHADPDAAGDATLPVGHQHLPVVARQETEPGAEARRVERPDVESFTLELLEVRPGCGESPQPVDQDTDAHPTIGCIHKCLHEPIADLIPAEDVTLEIQGFARGLDERQHGIEGPTPIPQQCDHVPARHVRRRDSPERAGERRSRAIRQADDVGSVDGLDGHI